MVGRYYGLILSFIFMLPFAFGACPSFHDAGNYFNSVIIELGQECVPSSPLNFYGGAYSGSVNELNIRGSLILNNTELNLNPFGNTIFNIYGTLIIYNDSIISAEDNFDSGSVSFNFFPNSKFILTDSDIENVLNMDVSGPMDFRMVNSSLNKGDLNIYFNKLNGLLINSSYINSTNSIKFNNSLNTNIVNASIIADQIVFRNSSMVSVSNSLIDSSSAFISSNNLLFENVIFKKNIAADNSTVSFISGSLSNNDVIVTGSSEISYLNLANNTVFSGNGSVKQSWTTKYRAVNFLGLPLSGVNVQSWNVFNDLIFEGSVNNRGELSHNVDEFFYVHNPENIINYNNYTTNFSKATYKDVSFSFNATKRAEFEIMLETEKNIIRQEGSCTDSPIRDFCAKKNPLSCGNLISGQSCSVTFQINATDNRIGPNSLIGSVYDFFVISQSTDYVKDVSLNESGIVRIKIVE